jgi:hypothetical protein
MAVSRLSIVVPTLNEAEGIAAQLASLSPLRQHCLDGRHRLSKELKAISPPLCLRSPVVTSGRRWEQHGVLRTVLKMWRLRLAFFLRADPARLAKAYGYESHKP